MDKTALANAARSRTMTGIKRSPRTRAAMSAARIVRVLKKRPESEYNAVFAEQLARFEAEDAVLAALEGGVEKG